MGNKMLIDSSHGEETRVVVTRGSRIEEFDFESASRRPLKGNIYLAKVTRVEPSLQAAFVDYGGNRHGFLAFTEIHPDYYQIPIADRLALIKEQEEEAAAEAADDDDDDEIDHAGNASSADEGNPDRDSDSHDDGDSHDDEDSDDDSEEETPESDDRDDQESPVEANESESIPRTQAFASEPEPSIQDDADADEAGEGTDENGGPENNGEIAPTAAAGEIVTVDDDMERAVVDSVGAEDALEEVPRRKPRQQRRRYKIQEVIKRRQILLVQVVKEERGNKGAALTTYLSLAGRYCVLMPNTARGGGISRKITDAGDRRRLKEVARDIEIPQGMGLIVRTAGAQRTRPEIKRDFDYLIRLWESVRDLTLQSQAPSLVYEEGSLIKRSIRDLYTKDVDEVIVEGEASYKEAKDFMRMLMPSHAKNVKLYKENRPLFARFQVESHLDALYSPTVNLPSGGYIVINQTEALVSIDINSGRATREHSIEDTAVKTNLEASDEIARQLRLRDLAGLIVIDYIDMEENRNNRSVERRMKDALKNDRARIQVGRISHFGLLEMSRQRLRPGLTEGTFRPCPHCEGRGIVRSVSSCGLGVLRAIEDYLQNKRADNLTVKCARDVAFFLLNEKRDNLLAIEQSYGITIFVIPGGDDLKGTQSVIERAVDRDIAPRRILAGSPVQIDSALDGSDDEIEDVVDEAADVSEEESEAGTDASTADDDGNGQSRNKDGRRRRRRGRRGSKGGNGHQGRHGSGEASDEGNQSEDRIAGDLEADDVPFREAAQDDEQGSTEAEAGDEGDDSQPQQEGEGGDGNNRRRKRFGRGRGRRDRGERPGNAPREGRPPREDRGPRDDRPPREERERPERARAESSTFAAAVEQPKPAPVTINIPEFVPDPEPRKWQPPAPTVSAEAATRRAGWWSKRKPE